MPEARRVLLARLFVLLAALWAGLVATLALVAAPTAFAVLERAQAGRVAGQMFRTEATAALVLAAVLILLERRLTAQVRESSDASACASASASALTPQLLLVLGALFCTVLGFHALQPMMEAARAGQGSYSFGALHGLSSALFALKGVLLLVLAWRASARVAPAAA